MKSTLESPAKTYAVRGLAQIERTAKDSIWDAHWGCAVIAGALLIAEDLVEDDAKPVIESLLKSLTASQKSFEAEAGSKRQYLERNQFAETLLGELAIKADDPREIGHAVIYSAYVLKALDYFGIPPWESLLARLTGLVRDINTAGPGWITVNGVNEPRVLQEAEMKTTADYWTLFAGFDRPLPMEVGDMQLGHLLTHGHAIHMFQAYAGPGLIAVFDHAYRRRLHGLRLANGLQRDQTPLPRRIINPRTKDYWGVVEMLGDMHGHALKYAYSFLALRGGRISTADLESYGRIVWPAKAVPATG